MTALDLAASVRLLTKVLAGVPRLPGAACTGLEAAFDAAHPNEDATEVEYRHQTAVNICTRCPALDACREWIARTHSRDRPAGVLAAQHPRPPGRPTNRTEPTT